MKKNLIAIIIFFFAFSLHSQTKWELITCSHSNGSVAPKYQWKRVITITNTGKGEYSYDTNADNDTSFSNEFQLSKKELKKLNSAVKKSKIMKVLPGEMRDLTKRKSGGWVEKIIIKPADKNSETEDNSLIYIFPMKEKYAEAMDDLYNLISELVPQDCKKKNY